MDILKEYLEEAFEEAHGRELAVLGFQSAGAVVYCAMKLLGKTPECFLDIDRHRIGKDYFGIPVKAIDDVLSQNPGQYYIIDAFPFSAVIRTRAERFGLSAGKDYTQLHGLFHYDICDLIDPLLVYSRSEDVLPGFRICDNPADDRKKLKIAALGGSTTDPSYSGLKSWPEYLHETLEERGIPNTVFNGGIVGYTSSQERDKFLRDVLPLKPDVTVILTGDNDIGWNHCDRDHNYYSSYLMEQLVNPVYRKAVRKDEEVYLGRNVERSDSENWFRNQEIIQSVGNEFGICVITALQPSILSAGYRMSPFEEGWMQILGGQWKEEYRSVRGLMENSSAFYKDAGKRIAERPGYEDLTGALNELSGVYFDGIHCDEQGNRLLARRFADIIHG